jgi:hypothetical protein
MSSTTDGIHTTTNPKSTGWVNQANGVVLTTHRIKATAIKKGRQIAKAHGEQYTIHRKDGTVVQTRVYGVSPI